MTIQIRLLLQTWNETYGKKIVDLLNKKYSEELRSTIFFRLEPEAAFDTHSTFSGKRVYRIFRRKRGTKDWKPLLESDDYDFTSQVFKLQVTDEHLVELEFKFETK